MAAEILVGNKTFYNPLLLQCNAISLDILSAITSQNLSYASTKTINLRVLPNWLGNPILRNSISKNSTGGIKAEGMDMDLFFQRSQKFAVTFPFLIDVKVLY